MPTKLPTKRFGARYGRKPKTKFANIEAQHRTKQKCPYCNKTSVKRLAAGIWECGSCSVKLAGRAYSL